jgi:uncharacterized protein (DUF885 family)
VLHPDRQPSAVDARAEAFWQRILELSPLTATLYGDPRFDDRLPDPGPAGRAASRRLAEDLLAASREPLAEGSDTEDRITLDMFGVVGALGIEEDDHRLDTLQVVDQMSGPQTLLPQLAQFQPADTPERFERFMARIAAYPTYMAANVELVREGLASGLTAPRIVAERTIAQLDRMLAMHLDEGIIPSLAKVASEDDREVVRRAVHDLVVPAEQAFLDALRGDYLAATREEPGLWSAPGGEAIYRTLIRHWTTLELDPGEVHRYGVEQMAAIDADRHALAAAAGYPDPRAYRAALATDPANVPDSPDAIIAGATRMIDAAMAVAGRWFPAVPEAGCIVRAVESFKERDAPPAYYFPPAADGSRPGIFYVNTFDLPTRTLHRLAPITAHEAVPGHHFQIALEGESGGLNSFRRFGSRLAGAAFAEGWGLYSERLADEMGLYTRPDERFAMLDMQSWRAARLVVDTGIHALRWPRERSIEVLLEAGLSVTDAEIETDRYIANPGQALAYKIGQREIERLRTELAARDGAAFDLRAFHGALLAHGSLPLATLEAELPGWVRPSM